MTRRHSPAVYRRRRLAVLSVVILILAGIGFGVWLLIAQPWQGAAAQTPEEKPVVEVDESEDEPDAAGEEGSDESEAEQEPEDAASDSEGADAEAEVTPCTASDLTILPVTDATSYGSGKMPQLSIELTNDSDVDCTINVGSSTQVFTIVSGEDVWWRSTDCQKNSSDMEVTLAAGQTVTSAQPVEWNRTRSSVKTCDSESRPAAPAGGASYHVSVEIGGVEGAETKHILLN